MTKAKKILATVLAMLMLGTLSIGVLADEPEDDVDAVYASVTGVVSEIVPFYDDDEEVIEGVYYVFLDLGDEEEVVFVVDEDTIMIADNEEDEDAVEAGDVFTGFYNATLPMILIYPPQYYAVVAAVNLAEDMTLKTAVFDDELLSDDGLTQLVISDDTVVCLANGDLYAGDLGGKHLAVVYGISTKSIPEQAMAELVIIIETNIEKPVYDDETIAFIKSAAADAEVVVNNEIIECPAPYATDDGVVMVPLRAVAEALGYEVSWDAETRSVLVGQGITLSIGADYYTYMRMAPITLGTAPELSPEGYTYVPVRFFSDVAMLPSAYMFEGQIVIDVEDLMGE